MAGTLAFPFNGSLYQSTNLPTNMDVKDFGTMIHRVFQGGTAPLFALLSELPTGTALNIEHGYWQKAMIIPSSTVGAGGQIAADTTWTMVDTSQLVPGQVLRVPATGENVLVLTVASSTSITVRRAFGTTAAGAVAAGAQLMVVGNAFEEASNRPNAQSYNPAYIKNYTQIFRNAWAVSGSAAAIKMLVGDGNVAENRRDCIHFHSAAIENALLFSQLYTGSLNGRPVRGMDGILSMVGNQAYYPPSFAAANVFVAGGTTSYTQLEQMLESTLNQRMESTTASTDRVIFTGSKGMQVFNQIARLNTTYMMINGQETTAFGMQFRTLKTSRGTFRLIEHPILNSNAVWSAMAFVLDLSCLKLSYLGGRKTIPSEYGYDASGTNIVKVPDNGQDAIGGDLLTEVTLECLNVPGNAVISNLTAGAAG